MTELSPEKVDFFKKLEEFEKMINSNLQFNKTIGKIKSQLQVS